MNIFEENNFHLENERVILRSLHNSDEKLLLPYAINEPEIWNYSLIQAIGKEGLKNYIDLALKAKSDKTQYPFVVIDKQNNVVVGCTRLYDLDFKNLTTQIGYTWYGKEFQGTDINVNCKLLLLQFVFEVLKFERVQLMADTRNGRSIAAMQKIGCIQDGILRKNYISANGTRRDSAIFSILKGEWESFIKVKIAGLIEKYESNV